MGVIADLHIHTVLSPCGDLDMSPIRIVERAREVGIDLLGVTDHNSTLQCDVVRQVGEREGLYVMCGAEITTKEEVHVLVFVEWGEPQKRLQQWIDESLPQVKNDVELFGYQLVVDQSENITYQEDRVLINALDKTIEQAEEFVHSLGGLFIPAHIDKSRDSIISQLGFVPPYLNVDALELSPNCRRDEYLEKFKYLSKYNLITGSDAHYLEEIGRSVQRLEVLGEELSFESIKAAIVGLRQR